MKKVVFVSGNGMLIEKMTAILNSRADLHFLLLSTSRIDTLLHDIEIFRAHTVIVDATYFNDELVISELCKLIQSSSIVRECLLLVNSNDTNKQVEVNTDLEKWIDGYVIFDDSLDSLFDRLMEK